MKDLNSESEVVYLENDVKDSTLNYFHGNVLTADTVVRKYLHRNDKNEYLDLNPDHIHQRIARELAKVESKYPNPLSQEVIYSYLKDFSQIIPQGSPISAIGNKYHIQSTSNCFLGGGVDEKSDSYGGILKADQEIVQIAKRRGGIGQDISGIRPKGAITRNSAKTSDGIGVFMERYSNSTNEVAQSGRRGALMLTCDVEHPDIYTFATIKNDDKKVTGANISIKLSKEFMDCVQNDKDYYLRYPTKSKLPEDIDFLGLDYDKLTKIGKQYIKKIKAKDLWDTINHSAWLRAEPGLLFWDTVVDKSPTTPYKDFGFLSISTNPCGEIVLSPYDSCRLFVVNLCYFVENKFTPKAYFNVDKYLSTVRVAQRLMDDLIDLELDAVDRIIAKVESDPEDWSVKQFEYDLWKRIRVTCENGRRTGLGITGLGDVLAMLNITYGSQESIDMTDLIYKNLAKGSYETSIKLASERGSFPVYSYDLEKDHEWLNSIIDILEPEYQEMYKVTGRRNIACNTTAPTGTTSMMSLLGEFDGVKYFGTTSGIEPVFLIGYDRRTKIMTGSTDTPDFVDNLGVKWKTYTVYHSGVELYRQISKDINLVNNPYLGSTSADIDWVNSVKLQGQAQKWVDHSISKTVNVPNNVTQELIANIYMTAYEVGCKGVTVYRDGCRSGVLVETNKKTVEELPQYDAPKRPEKVKAEIHFSHIDRSKWILIVGLIGDKPYELFGGIIPEELQLSKSIKEGYLVKVKKGHYDLLDNDDKVIIKDICNTLNNTTYNFHTRMVSMTLRHGTPVQYLIDQLNRLADKEIGLYTFNKVVVRVLKKFIPNGFKSSGVKCVECGSTNLAYQEGCLTCLDCGNSKCN